MNDHDDYLTNASFEVIHIENANTNVFGLALEKIEAFENDMLEDFAQEINPKNAQGKTVLNPSGGP